MKKGKGSARQQIQVVTNNVIQNSLFDAIISIISKKSKISVRRRRKVPSSEV